MNPCARIVQRTATTLAERSTIPFHHLGNQLCNSHFSLRAYGLERGRQRKPHSETTDQHPG